MANPVVISSPEIWNRLDFPILCNWRKLWRAAEIGVERGEFSQHFLNRWQGDRYWGIDAYWECKDQPYNREADFLIACQRFERHGGRATLIKGQSSEVSRIFEKGSLDFVYIDGSHDYDSVMTDILSWWTKISDEGIIAGHDFDETHPQVMNAVANFAGTRDIQVYLTNVPGYGQEACPSWYAYKSGIPGPRWRRC